MIANHYAEKIDSIYNLILHDDILEYKYKNSKHKDKSNVENIYKGSIFTFRSKEDMTRAKGIVLTSKEALYDVKDKITHWTPNIFRYAAYSNKERKIVEGHSEENLKQINTFYIDIDHTEINEYDILQASINLQFMPTCIIKTDRGYQVYFVLKTPVYITAKTDFKAIETAKIISKNLRGYFQKEGFNVDVFCNHFGIARFPNKTNVVYYDENNVYPFLEWIDWSTRQSDDFYHLANKNFYIIKGSKGITQVDEKWFALLLNSNHVRGAKELLGRNNVLFTLALACYSSGLNQDQAEEKLRVFNDNLETKLKEKEYLTIIKSAYSGRYNAASREYVFQLAKSWIREDVKSTDLFAFQKWVKFKKERKDRKRTHFEEWENDVLKYISQKDKIYLEIKKKDILECLKIPKRSLDTVLKSLQEKKLIFYKSTAGRTGGIKIALLKKVYAHTLSLVNTAKERFMNKLAQFFEEGVESLKIELNKYIEKLYLSDEYELFEEDVGRVVFV